MSPYRPMDEVDGTFVQASPHCYKTIRCEDAGCPSGAQCHLRDISGTHCRVVHMVEAINDRFDGVA